MELEQIPMPYPCCEHCRHPRHPQFTGHPMPCYHCELEKLARSLEVSGELPPGMTDPADTLDSSQVKEVP